MLDASPIFNLSPELQAIHQITNSTVYMSRNLTNEPNIRVQALNYDHTLEHPESNKLNDDDVVFLLKQLLLLKFSLFIKCSQTKNKPCCNGLHGQGRGSISSP